MTSSTDDEVREFFDAPPLNPREARRLEGQRRAQRRNDAHDETGSLSEDEERALADRCR
jgi:hypothetical protein